MTEKHQASRASRTHQNFSKDRPSSDQRQPHLSHRGELYSCRLKNAAGSSFFLNLKENRTGDIYLNLVESQPSKPQNSEMVPGNFRRHSILVFEEQRQEFAAACLAALDALTENRDYHAELKGLQRSFFLQVERKHQGRLFCLREESQHYDKLLREQIRIPRDSAYDFSVALIAVLEKWLDLEARSHRAKQKKAVPRKN